MNTEAKILNKKNLLKIIIPLSILVGFYFSVEFVQSTMQNIFKETILNETAPNGKFDLQIESSSIFDFGTGIIIYTKDNTSKNSKLVELCNFNIHQDMSAIHSDDVNLIWENNTAILSINGEIKKINLIIWMDDKTNKFEYEYKTIFLDNE